MRHKTFVLFLDERIAQDNREIEKRKPLRRSTSDVTEVRPPTSRYKNPPTGKSCRPGFHTLENFELKCW